MSRLSYFFKRLVRIDRNRMRITMDRLKEESGRSSPRLLADMLVCGVKYNAGYMDYRIAQMYKLNGAQRRTVITRGINNGLVRRMNDKAYWHHFDDKAAFNQLFSKWVHRDWLRVDENLTSQALRDFLQTQKAVFVKPIEGSSGVGIAKYDADAWQDMDAFEKQLRAQGTSIIEENITQHPDMARLYPGSVNTVRIATLRGEKKEGIVYAFLRIGNGKPLDNVDAGGMAARVDLDTGTLQTVAADKQSKVYTHHPLTNTPIVGFQLPYFEEAKAMCLEAMNIVPQLKYVAWDVALTPEGPQLIEGNSFPSHAVPQFAAHYPDGYGILTEFRQFTDL